MTQFTYEAISKDGRSVKGKMTSSSERDVQRSLREQGLTPISVQKTETAPVARSRFMGKPKTQDYILVLDELSVLLDSGVPLASSIESIENSGIHPDISLAFYEMGKDLKRGGKFSETLLKNIPALPSYVYQLIAAGEMTGNLGKALGDSAKQMDYDLKLTQDIRSALTYPAILVTVGLGAVIFIFISVVPKFDQIFAGRTDIPGLTQAIISTGNFFNNNINAIAIFLVLFGLGLWSLFKQEAVRQGFMDIVPRIPLMGTWIVESEIGRWATTLAILLNNKISLMDSLSLSRKGLKIPLFRNQMQQVESAVRGGKSLAEALKDNTQLTPLSINLVQVGEKAGRLPQMLESLAKIYDRASKQRMKNFLALIEPGAIILIGGGIGLIFAGIVLGMTSIMDTSL